MPCTPYNYGMDNSNRTVPLSLRVTSDMLDALKARAEQEERPLSTMAAKILKDALFPHRQTKGKTP
jgi:hypothetical protein